MSERKWLLLRRDSTGEWRLRATWRGELMGERLPVQARHLRLCRLDYSAAQSVLGDQFTAQGERYWLRVVDG